MGFCVSGQRETGRRKQLNTPIFLVFPLRLNI